MKMVYRLCFLPEKNGSVKLCYAEIDRISCWVNPNDEEAKLFICEYNDNENNKQALMSDLQRQEKLGIRGIYIEVKVKEV